MATFEKIRRTSPYILGLFATVFILFMVLADVDPSTFRGDQRNQAIADVAGKEIDYNTYENLVRQQLESQKQQIQRQGGDPNQVTESSVRSSAWRMLIDEKVFDVLAENAGLYVSDDVVGEELLNNPPAYIRQSWTDSTGRFMQAQYQQMVTNPEAIISAYGQQAQQMPEQQRQQLVQDFRDRLIQASEQIKLTMKENTIRSLIASAGSIVSPEYAKQKYINENSNVDFDYVKFDINTIKDDEISITEETLKKYFNEINVAFDAEPKRKIKYVSFPLVPSKEDLERSRTKIEDIAQALTANKDNPEALNQTFSVKMDEYSGETSNYTLVHELDPNISGFITTLEIGEYFGPVDFAGKTNFIKLDDKREGEEMAVDASHILIRFNDNKDSALKEANRIYQLAKNGDNFSQLATEYSEDRGSAVKGGSLGYFGKGMMVPEFEEAAFAANIGIPTEPVESQFGYHIIMVNDKAKEEIKYSIISVETKMSGVSKNQIFRDAYSFYTQVTEKGKLFNNAAEEANLNATETAFFNKEQTVLGNNLINAFAFKNDVGTISEPIEVENYGVVVYIVSDELNGSEAPFETRKTDIELYAKTQLKLDKLSEKVNSIYNSANGSLETAARGLTIQSASNTKNNGNVTGMSGKLWELTEASYSIPVGELSKPIRTESGYYLIRVKSRNLVPNDFVTNNLPEYQNKMTNNLKQQVSYQWFNKIKKDLEIVDNRDNIYTKY